MNRKRFTRMFAPLLLITTYYFLFTLIGTSFLPASSVSQEEKRQDEENGTELEVESEEKLVEDKRIYQYDDESSVSHFYITILPQEDQTTFYQLNNWYQNHSLETKGPSLEVIIQEGDENGPKKGGVGYGMKQANGTIQIRGNSSRLKVQKSYKLKLSDRAGLWKGQSILNLNKHADDSSRVKNKLTFDYFKLMPDIASIRTQFVELHVLDLSENSKSTEYQSYGLYTHVEQVNKRYLASHGLNPYGNLYKATNFEFFRYPEHIKLESDPNYNQEVFEQILEIEEGKDHSKLIGMLDAVNDYSKNINEIVDQYFDRDNYLTWLSSNILFGNVDTMSTNYFLYSPTQTNKWYFIPWDYDKAWGYEKERTTQLPKWQLGLERYWGNVLHRRFLKDERNIKALNEKIEELSTTLITPEQTEYFLSQYAEVVQSITKRKPDSQYLPIPLSAFDANYQSLVNIPEESKQRYYERLEYPMPIFMAHAFSDAGNHRFTWEPSFDFQGDDLTYTFQLAKDPDMTTIFFEEKGLKYFHYEMDRLSNGIYYFRILTTDEKGNVQIPFDKFLSSEGTFHWGVQQLIVNE
ncbi:CotH kinase family protein [Bacillus timonensis]|nr:CotH kinase family protein [Bacillus timonensis]